MMKRSNDTTGRAGEHYVAAELSRRGAYASPFSGNVPGIDVIATDRNRERNSSELMRSEKLAASDQWVESLCMPGAEQRGKGHHAFCATC